MAWWPSRPRRVVGRSSARCCPRRTRRRRSPSRVHCSYRWIADDGDLVGFLAIRHALNDFLREEGGHIGYSVRPSRRREGHATLALALALAEARALGIERALVTCDTDNVASARTIERNGGVLEDVRHGKRRYWIDLA
ncbi:MAG: GNAT family N-acetyltransferase [Nocardioides sp.]